MIVYERNSFVGEVNEHRNYICFVLKPMDYSIVYVNNVSVLQCPANVRSIHRLSKCKQENIY